MSETDHTETTYTAMPASYWKERARIAWRETNNFAKALAEARAERDALAARLRGIEILASDVVGDREPKYPRDEFVTLQQVIDMALDVLDGEDT